MKVYRGANLRHPRKVIYDTPITLLFDKKTITRFKEIVGKGYQVKIRELVQMYIDAYERKHNG